jgi:hypothetical protein
MELFPSYSGFFTLKRGRRSFSESSANNYQATRQRIAEHCSFHFIIILHLQIRPTGDPLLSYLFKFSTLIPEWIRAVSPAKIIVNNNNIKQQTTNYYYYQY